MNDEEIQRAHRMATSILLTCFRHSKHVTYMMEQLMIFVGIVSMLSLYLLHGLYFYEPVIYPDVYQPSLPTAPTCTCLSNYLYNQSLLYYADNMDVRKADNCTDFVNSQRIIKLYVRGLVDEYQQRQRRISQLSINEEPSLNQTVHNQTIFQSITSTIRLPFSVASQYIYSKYLNDTQLFVFAQEKGMLYLSKSMKEQLNISILEVTIVPWEFECLSNAVPRMGIMGHVFSKMNRQLQKLISATIGYDTIMINQFMEYANNTGVLYSNTFDELFHLKYVKEFLEDEANMNLVLFGIYRLVFSPIPLYALTFLLTFYLLRCTQRNIIIFIMCLQHWLRTYNQWPVRVVFKILIGNTFQNLMFFPMILGVIAFLAQYYQDKFIAGNVLAIIWITQPYMMHCRAATTRLIFPWIFHFLMIVYIQYTVRCPFGFTYMALVPLISFIVAAMLFFWNRYEYRIVQASHPLLGNNMNNTQVPRMAQVSQRITFRIDNIPENQILNLNLNGDQNVRIQVRRNNPLQQPQVQQQQQQ